MGRASDKPRWGQDSALSQILSLSLGRLGQRGLLGSVPPPKVVEILVDSLGVLLLLAPG